MIHDIKKVYENTIILGKVEGDKKEYICRIYKYLVTPKSFGVKENTYICYFEEIENKHENNEILNKVIIFAVVNFCLIIYKYKDIIWRYKYIYNRNNQVDKIIKQTKLSKGAMLEAIRRR